jgi:hypothetical protein
MKALSLILAGGVAAAALIGAAPAAAQYYPGSPYAYGNPGGPIFNQPFGGGYGSNPAVNQCVAAVQARLNGGGAGGYGYGYNGSGYNGYGYNGYGTPGGYGGARVLGVSRVEPRSNGGLTVRGVANSGRYAGYGYGDQGQVDLTWKCKTDYRGFISDIDIDRAQRNYGSDYQRYDDDYSQYGYRRY